MKKVFLQISICLLVFTQISYSQTSNNFSGYVVGGAAKFKNQNDFKNQYNFSPGIGLDLHLKRFSLGLEGSLLKAQISDLTNFNNMGSYVPAISGSNKLQSFQFLIGPGFDIISINRFKLNLSALAGLNFLKTEIQSANLTIPVNSNGLNNPTYLLSQSELSDTSSSKFVIAPSMTIKYQVSKKMAIILKTSYNIRESTTYNSSSRDLTGINWSKDPKIIMGYLIEHKLNGTSLEKNYSNLYIGIGIDFTLWTKDKPKKEQEKRQNCPSDITVCIDKKEFTLSGGHPVGGVYSGKGITNGVFNPAVADSGVHIINYTPPGSHKSCSFKISVKPRPKLTCPKDTSVFINSGVFELRACKPSGGVYTGEGVTEGKFNPITVGGGAHKITYKYKEQDSCEDSCVFNIHVMKYYYELSKETYSGYCEVSGDTINIQYSNSYATTNSIFISVLDVDSQVKIEKKISKNLIVKPPSLFNINGVNRISVGLKDYPLQTGKLYQLTVSDAKNFYYLNFKVIKSDIPATKFSPKKDLIKGSMLNK